MQQGPGWERGGSLPGRMAMEGARSIPSSCKQLSLPEMTAIPGFVCCRGRSRGHERRGLPAIAAVWSHLFPGVSSTGGLSGGPAPAGPSIPSPPHSPFSPRSRGRCAPWSGWPAPAPLPILGEQTRHFQISARIAEKVEALRILRPVGEFLLHDPVTQIRKTMEA